MNKVSTGSADITNAVIKKMKDALGLFQYEHLVAQVKIETLMEELKKIVEHNNLISDQLETYKFIYGDLSDAELEDFKKGVARSKDLQARARTNSKKNRESSDSANQVLNGSSGANAEETPENSNQ